MSKKLLPAGVALSMLGTFSVTTLAGASTPTSLKGMSGAQINAFAISQMKAARSYTMVEVSDEPGLKATSVTTSNLTSGVRHDDINGHFGERRYVHGVAYTKFDAGLVKVYFGKSISSVANHWVSFTSGHKYYSTFANTMTESSLAPLLVLHGSLRVSAPLTLMSHRVVAVSSVHSSSATSPSFSETFYVQNTAPFLPVALVLSSSASTKPLVELTFKDWGHPVSVAKPADVTPSWRTPIG